MAAANTDKFKKVAPNTGWQLGASGISDAVVNNFSLVSASGLPTDTAVIITVDRVDASGAKTPTKMERITGVISGDNVISCLRAVGGTAQAHAGGAVVEILVSDDNINDLMVGILAEHNQDGTHKSAVQPIGAITQYAGSASPSGWLLCDGAAISRATYAALFAILSTTYGIGDGSTTFNLPNLKGKVVVGYDSGQTEFNSLGKTGGEKTHLLTGAESGEKGHNHTQDSHYHNIGGNTLMTVAGSGWFAAASGFAHGVDAVNVSGTTATNQAVAASNASTAHNNLSPYIILNFIIKT
ncbi:MAG: tail fiber protein [Parcubacteria group bacterium]|jgi:microcystin-dependent protein